MAATSSADVTHLWRRAAFGIDADGADDRAGRPWADLVAELVDQNPQPIARPPALDDPSLAGPGEFFRGLAIADAWIDHMATTTAPGAEKLCWFWHNHFTTSMGELQWGEGIWRQLGTVRSRAHGSFRALLGDIVVDSAMCFYLDNVSNVAGYTNENFARELLELYTVGVDHYTQADVIGAARSMTGHNVDWTGSMLPRYYPELHDNGTKTVLGSSGNYNANGLCDVLCNSTNKVLVARWIVKRLWSSWAYPNPSNALVADLATTVLADGFTGRSFARAVLLHPEFRSEQARSALLRTPIELVIALCRVSGVRPSEVGAIHSLGPCGHLPYLPPNVGGWTTARNLATPQAWWHIGRLHVAAAWLAYSATPSRIPDTSDLPSEEAARVVLRWAGIVDPNDDTVAGIADYLDIVRASSPDSEPVSAAMAATLSPDFATGGGI